MEAAKSGGIGKWALPAALGLALLGVGAFLYVIFAAASKPEAGGTYARMARGAMSSLIVLEEPPAQPVSALQGPDGAPVTLADFRGEVTLVNLWATWCAPCMEEMPTLGDLQRRFEGREFQVVAVNFDAVADHDDARAELDRLSGGNLAFIADPTRKLMFDFKARGMPTTILYDREGRELARLTGGADWDSAEAVALVEAALGE